jgi:hypothetical protein
MLRNRKVQYAILGGGLPVLLALLVWQILPAERRPSPDQLARQALEAATPAEQEVAAVRLAELGTDAKDHLRQVLTESQSAAVRAACIRGLAAQWDYDTMPMLLDALEDPSPLVRGRAGVAVQRLLGADFGFRCDDPPEKRGMVVKRLRQEWERVKDTPAMQQWQRRQQSEP